jgi:hypothetical protein
MAVPGCSNETLLDELFDRLPVKPTGKLSQCRRKAAGRLDSGAKPDTFEKLTAV